MTMVVCSLFNTDKDGATESHTPTEADVSWRLILMLGGVPAALTYYWRMMMPETARFTALVERDPMQAAIDMGKVLDVPIAQITEDENDGVDAPPPPNPPLYPLFSTQFLRLHGRDLFSCATTWFLIDVAFYTNNLLQSRVYHYYIDPHLNAYKLALKVASLQAIFAICSTIPGYWFTVFFIDKIGRVKIQLWGFLMMALVYFAIGFPYTQFWDKQLQRSSKNSGSQMGFAFLYGLTFFFRKFRSQYHDVYSPSGIVSRQI